MPSYTKRTVAELRQLCDDKQILCEGLPKPALIQALREYDETHEGNDCELQSLYDVDNGDVNLGDDEEKWRNAGGKAVHRRGAMIMGRVTVRVSPPPNHRGLAAEKGNCV